jgi:hypothetical protein
MKKFKTGLLALALVVAVGGTFATKVASAAKRSDPTYNWTSASIAPSNPSSTLNNATRAVAVDHFGCDQGTQDCADGTKVSGTGSNTAILQIN